MFRLFAVLLSFLTVPAYGADYFFCKDTNASFKDDHYLIELGGVTKYSKGQRWFQLSFKSLDHDVFRAISWAEPLTNKAKLWASYVPEAYNEDFLATLSTRHDVLIKRTELSCKRVYWLIGRP
jgi:hypothetical protein